MAAASVLAAGHPLTAEAAAHALREGGNAFDAVLAGWLTACLAEPVLTSPGGGGFAMVVADGASPLLYDFFAQTPKAVWPGARSYPLEADFGSTRQVFHLGAGSLATPGCVAGLLRLHGDFGRLPVHACAEPARHHSRQGVAINSHAATLLEVVAALYRATPESRRLFGRPGGSSSLLREGDVFRNPEFEGFLDQLVAEGARWFYEGDIARVVDGICRDQGGHLRREDFEAYRVHIREPLELDHRGCRIWLNPPPSVGGTLIALGLASRDPGILADYPFSGPDDWREWIEPLRLMSRLRSPGKAKPEDARLLETALQRAPRLSQAIQAVLPGALPLLRANGTTQLSVIDRDANVVSLTTSNGAGSAVIAPGTGFMLNNMLGEEDLLPDGLGSWIPDVRLSSMMAPTLVRPPQGGWIALGSGGSNRIRSTVLQLLRHLTEGGLDLEAAVLAPRLHWENGQIHAETDAWERLRAVLPEAAPALVPHPVPNLFFGGAHSATLHADGRREAHGDPRRGGVARSVP